MGSKRINKGLGTQAIERAIAVLREISASGQRGVRLSDIARRCELHTSTAHRILSSLVQEGLVRQQPGSPLYRPGATLFEFGLSFSDRSDLQYAVRSKLATLAAQTNSIGFLIFRSGDNFICGMRVGGAGIDVCGFPGHRLPLVMSSGGAAMLLALPGAEATVTISRNIANLSNCSDIRIQSIHRMLQRSSSEGFGVSAGNILPGLNSFGVPLRDASGTPFAAISLTGPARMLPLERRTEIRDLLQEAAEGLGTAAVSSIPH